MTCDKDTKSRLALSRAAAAVTAAEERAGCDDADAEVFAAGTPHSPSWFVPDANRVPFSHKTSMCLA